MNVACVSGQEGGKGWQEASLKAFPELPFRAMDCWAAPSLEAGGGSVVCHVLAKFVEHLQDLLWVSVFIISPVLSPLLLDQLLT